MKEYKINSAVSVILSDSTWSRVQRERSEEIHHAREIYNTPIDHPQYDPFSADEAINTLLDNFGTHFVNCIVRCTGG